jgi:hypothetical protein
MATHEPTLILRCGRCRTVLDAPPLPQVPAAGFYWPCPRCRPDAYADGYWVPTTIPELMRPDNIRFVPMRRPKLARGPPPG